MNTEEMLEDLAEGLSKSREANGVCPSRKIGTEIDGTETAYCPLDTVKCEHKGKTRCFDNGDFKLLNYYHCRYEGK